MTNMSLLPKGYNLHAYITWLSIDKFKMKTY